jgi:hypothetical protein
MKKNNMLLIILMCTVGLLNKCVCHWQSEIIAVKNSTSDSLLISRQLDDIMTDSILYDERFYKDYIGANTNSIITLPNRKPSQAADSEKLYLYFFNMDSVYKYQRIKQVKGIVGHSLLKKTIIQLNKVKEPLDTIIIK